MPRCWRSNIGPRRMRRYWPRRAMRHSGPTRRWLYHRREPRANLARPMIRPKIRSTSRIARCTVGDCLALLPRLAGRLPRSEGIRTFQWALRRQLSRNRPPVRLWRQLRKGILSSCLRPTQARTPTLPRQPAWSGGFCGTARGSFPDRRLPARVGEGTSAAVRSKGDYAAARPALTRLITAQNASTTAASNCDPAQHRSSASADSESVPRRYGRSVTIAS
jgi:hypothetical protein